MKRLLSIVLSAAMLLTIAACGSQSFPGSSPNASSQEPVDQSGGTEPVTDFPTKSIEITVPYAAGGSIDLCARILGKYIEPILGQPVVIQNREGGGGATGTTFAATASADGYTMICNVPTHMYQNKTAEGITYDRSSFRSVAQVADDPICIAALAGEYDSLEDLLNAAREAPDTITIGITSNWGAYDLGRLMIENAADVSFRRVSYDGGANGVMALLSGEINCMLTFPGDILPYKESGDVNILAVGLEQRNDAMPDVPTFTELGYDVIFGNLRFFSVPADTPDDVVAVLEAAVESAYGSDEFKEEMNNSGFPVLVYKSGAELDKQLITLEEQLMPLVDEMLVEKATVS